MSSKVDAVLQDVATRNRVFEGDESPMTRVDEILGDVLTKPPGSDEARTRESSASKTRAHAARQAREYRPSLVDDLRTSRATRTPMSMVARDADHYHSMMMQAAARLYANDDVDALLRSPLGPAVAREPEKVEDFRQITSGTPWAPAPDSEDDATRAQRAGVDFDAYVDARGLPDPYAFHGATTISRRSELPSRDEVWRWTKEQWDQGVHMQKMMWPGFQIMMGSRDPELMAEFDWLRTHPPERTTDPDPNWPILFKMPGYTAGMGPLRAAATGAGVVASLPALATAGMGSAAVGVSYFLGSWLLGSAAEGANFLGESYNLRDQLEAEGAVDLPDDDTIIGFSWFYGIVSGLFEAGGNVMALRTSVNAGPLARKIAAGKAKEALATRSAWPYLRKLGRDIVEQSFTNSIEEGAQQASQIVMQDMGLGLDRRPLDEQVWDVLHSMEAGAFSAPGFVIGGIPARYGMERVRTTALKRKVDRMIAQLDEGALKDMRENDKPSLIESITSMLSSSSNDPNLYIDPNDLQRFHQSRTPEERASLLAAMPDTFEQIEMAQQSGAQVIVPIADYAVHMKDYHDELGSFIRASPTMETVAKYEADAAEALAAYEAAIDELIEAPEQPPLGSLAEKEATLHAMMVDRAMATGRVGRDEARGFADQVVAFSRAIIEQSPKQKGVIDTVASKLMLEGPTARTTLERAQDLDSIIDEVRTGHVNPEIDTPQRAAAREQMTAATTQLGLNLQAMNNAQVRQRLEQYVPETDMVELAQRMVPEQQIVDAELLEHSRELGVAMDEGREKTERGLADEILGLEALLPYMTAKERGKTTRRTARTLLTWIAQLPSVQELAAIAKGGIAKRGWYARSARALIEIFGLIDAPRFAALLAATSPQTSVESNAINAINIWTEWIKRGRPSDADAIFQIMADTVERADIEKLPRARAATFIARAHYELGITHPLLQQALTVPVRVGGEGVLATRNELGIPVGDAISREGFAYRGMTEEEYLATVGAGRGVMSRGDWSMPGEGTSYAPEAYVAEDYADFGRTDPTKTGRPNYLVEVERTDALLPGIGNTDYLRTEPDVELPATRVFRLEPRGSDIYAVEVGTDAYDDSNIAPQQRVDRAASVISKSKVKLADLRSFLMSIDEDQRVQLSVLPGWVNNTIRALQDDVDPQSLVISGPKVNSFMLNLRDFVNEVTLDTWMAHIFGIDQKKLSGSEVTADGLDPGKNPAYIAGSLHLRRVAEYLSLTTGEEWTPAEVQETIWSWAKALREQSKSADEKRTAYEIVQEQGGPDVSRIDDTPDFEVLFVKDKFAKLLGADYAEGIERARESIRARTAQSHDRRVAANRPEGGVALELPHLLRAAARLDRLGHKGAKKDRIVTLAQRDNWGADSVVVDDSGNLLVLAHSTNANFTGFQPLTHFGTVEAAADREEALVDFSENVVGRDAGTFRTERVQLNIENPLRIPDLASIDAQTGRPLDEVMAEFEQLDEEEQAHLEETGEAPRPSYFESVDNEDLRSYLLAEGIFDIDDYEASYDEADLIRILEEKGYDGIVYQNDVEDAGSDSYIIFRPEQARLADGIVTLAQRRSSGGTPRSEALVARFGITTDPEKAGFVLPDGRLLDMSDGGQSRQLEHEDAVDWLNESGFSGTRTTEVTRIEVPIDQLDALLAEGAIRADFGSQLTGSSDAIVEMDREGVTKEARDAFIRAAIKSRVANVQIEFREPDGRWTGIHVHEPTQARIRRAFRAPTEEKVGRWNEMYQGNLAGFRFYAEALLDRETVIELSEASNFSSLPHEFSHFMLVAMQHFARQPNASPRLQQTVSTALATLGKDDARKLTDQDNETWARSYEAYLREGSAPSLELQRAFEMYSAALHEIYPTIEAIARANGAPLKPQLAATFDVILSTEQEREAARQSPAHRRHLTLIDDDDEEEFRQYEEAVEDALDQRMAKRRAQLMNRLVRGRKAARRRLKKQTREMIERDIRSLPIYQLRRFLATGTDWEGNQLAETHRLDIDTLRERHPKFLEKLDGKWILPRGGHGLTGKDGIAPWIAADMFGFQTVEGMLEKLRDEPDLVTAVREATDRRIADIDAIEEEELGAEYEETIEADLTEAWMRRELRVLARRAGRAPKPHLFAKTLASKKLRRLPVAQLQPKQYQRDEMAFAREVIEASDKQQWAQAHDAAHRQLISHYMYMEAQKLQERNQRDTSHIKLLRTPRRRQKIEGLGRQIIPTELADRTPDIDPTKQAAMYEGRNWYEQIENILDLFKVSGTKGRGSNQAATLQSFLRAHGWNPDPEATIDGVEDFGPDLSQVREWIVEQANRGEKVQLNALTSDQLHDVAETLRNIERAAERLGTITLEGEVIRIEEALEAMVASAVDNRPREALPGRNLRHPSTWLRTKAESRQNPYLRLGDMARMLDGGDRGPWHDAMILSMDAANEFKYKLRRMVAEELAPIFMEILTPQDMLLRGVETMTAGKLAQTPMMERIDYGGNLGPLSRMERLMMVLSLGNEISQSRLQKGENLLDEDIQRLIAATTEEEWRWAQRIWQSYDMLWDYVESMTRRLTGTTPERVTPQSINTGTSLGVIQGGYHPIKTDFMRPGFDAYQGNEDKPAETTLARGSTASFMTYSGYRKHRSKSTEIARPTKLDFSVITDHFDQVVQDLAWAEWVHNTTKLLRDKDLRNTLVEYYGADFYFQMLQHVNYIAVGDNVPSTAIDRFSDWLRSRQVVNILGGAISTMTLQPFGLTNTIDVLGAKDVVEYGIKPWVFGSSSEEMVGTIDMIRNKSSKMDRRWDKRRTTATRDIADLQRQLLRGLEIGSEVTAALMVPMIVGQMPVDAITWLTVYNKDMANGEKESRAILRADRAVSDTQASGEVTDLAEWQRGRGAKKLLTMFFSFFGATRAIDYVNRHQRRVAQRRGEAATARAVYDKFMLFYMPAVLMGIAFDALRGDLPDEPEEVPKWMLEMFALEPLTFWLNTYVFARVIGSSLQGFDYTNPAFKAYNDLAQLQRSLESGNFQSRSVRKAAVSLTGFAFRLPGRQINATIDGLAYLLEEDGDAFMLRHAAYGAPRKND